MMAAKTHNFKDSNIANIGSEEDIQQRRSVAATETAWRNAGKVPGLQIWRIEKFKVVPWPIDLYGSFFSGDSYIVLHTYKKKGSQALSWDIHFWLGRETTQDESGTAAYKTVELDDYLGGAPVQHRETQEHESDLFLSYFKNQIKIMEGGIDSGFKKVEAESYRPRLLHLKGKKRVRVTEVPLHRDSLNSGDVFILDAGLNVYQWVGRRSSGLERYKAASVCRAIDDERRGLVTIHVFVEGQKDEDIQEFWNYLGGEGPVKSAEEGGSDVDAERHDTKRLFRLSDASGKMEFTLVAEAGSVNRSHLDSNDVFILDTGAEVFAWIGKGSSPDEKRDALKYAQDYLAQYNRPAYIPISRILEGGENEIFEAALL